MFLKIDKIKVESKDSKHTGEIDVISWSWGMTQQGSSHLGSGAGTGKVDVQNLTITKYVDAASPNLIKFCCKGASVGSATLYIRKAGDKPVEYVKIEMTDGLISSVAVAGSSGDDRFTENISINFAAFKYYYTLQNKGAAGAETPASWNIAANAES